MTCSLQIIFVLCMVAAASAADFNELNFVGAERCPPDFRGTPPDCSADPYLPIPIEILRCPIGEIGYPPNCHPPCPAFHSGSPPNCVRIKCPSGWEGEYQPDCRYISCAIGMVGVYPNCYIPKPYVGCANGLIGNPPDCYKPCPQYYYGRDPNCTRIRCPNGWEGEYQPDCKFTPQCPPERPGVWPNCWSMYCPPGSIGVYPVCKCKPGFTGTPPDCVKDTKPPKQPTKEIEIPGPGPPPVRPTPPGPKPPVKPDKTQKDNVPGGSGPPGVKVTTEKPGPTYLPPGPTYLPASGNKI